MNKFIDFIPVDISQFPSFDDQRECCKHSTTNPPSLVSIDCFSIMGFAKTDLIALWQAKFIPSALFFKIDFTWLKTWSTPVQILLFVYMWKFLLLWQKNSLLPLKKQSFPMGVLRTSLIILFLFELSAICWYPLFQVASHAVCWSAEEFW